MKVQVIEGVGVPVERAWRVFSDFGNVREMMPGASIVIEGEGVGALRRIGTPDGEIVERLESWDPRSHSFSYAIVNENPPIPVTGYLATVQLRATSETRCEVEWSSEFDVRDAPENAVVHGMDKAYRAMIQRLREKLEASEA